MASIFIRTLLIYVFISFSLKIMGKRQLGELDVGEFVSTLLVSEVAALPIADQDLPLFNAIVPLILIMCLEILISFFKNKSEKLKSIVEGEPAFIIYKGRLLQKTLQDNRISINEFLEEMRIQGIGDICDINYAILESNGKISILSNSSKSEMAHTLIIDGEKNAERIAHLGYDDEWVEKKLAERKLKLIDTFLMTVDDNGKINIIRKEIK